LGTPLETKFLNKKEKDTYNNEGNITSNDNYVLNEKPFLNLKNELDLKVKEYFDKIICPSNKSQTLHNSILVELY
jgi:hypothetical protein